MPLIGSALRYHLHLRANRTIEVGRLTEGVDSEFLDALDRSRDDTGRYAIGLGAGGAGKIHRVADLVAGHVIAVLAAIDAKTILIADGAGNLASRRNPRLQRHECGGIAPEIWQQ